MIKRFETPEKYSFLSPSIALMRAETEGTYIFEDFKRNEFTIRYSKRYQYYTIEDASGEPLPHCEALANGPAQKAINLILITSL